MYTVSQYILIFLLFLLQFFYFPVGMSFFEGSKVYLTELLIFLLLILQLFSKEGIQLRLYPQRLGWPIGIFGGLSLFHLVFHQTETVLFGNQFRLQGTFLFLSLLLFTMVSSRITIEKLIKLSIVALVIFVQLACSLLFIGVGSDRPVGTLGEPNALAATVIFLWPFLLSASPKSLPMRGVALVGILAAFVILFVSGSRSGVIALGVQISFLLVVWLMRSKKACVYATIASLIILLAAYSTPFIGPRTEYEDRGEIWKAAVHAATAHPILGVGFGNAEYELHAVNVALGNKLRGYYVDSAHNIFLDWFIQTGIVGLGTFLVLLFQTFKTFIQREERRNIVLLIGILAALSFNPASVVSLVGLWWLVGQGHKSRHGVAAKARLW